MNALPELRQLETLLVSTARTGHLRTEVLTEVPLQGQKLPIHGIVIGSADRTRPTLGIFGGVHGLERVGSHVALSYLETLLQQLSWDESLREILTRVRVAAIPLVNPGGMLLNRRSNPRGVDLMRNAPVETPESPAFLVGGHRISPVLPWYRGEADRPMEPEAQALVDFVRREMFESEAAVALDLHSGFGLNDRLWHPYARTASPFPDLPAARSFHELLNRTLPHHIYEVGMQSQFYTTHGDLWDFLYDEFRAKRPDGLFLPWTLEMGSWIWVRKNPAQLFSALGPFNPLKPHRHKRVMRRHLPLMDFLLRATLNHRQWAARA